MPQFALGESKTAVAPITAKPAGMACEAELFLGPDDMTKIATSGRIPFVSTGVKQDIRFPITMLGEGTYPVYLDIFTNGLLIGAYKAVEDVIIVAPVVLSGIVTNALTGKPIVGAMVYVYSVGPLIDTETDSNGYYYLEIPRGEYAVAIGALYYEAQYLYGSWNPTTGWTYEYIGYSVTHDVALMPK